jgi:hypothetical protein
MARYLQTDAERDAAAARVLQSALDGRWLPEFVPGEPNGLAALETAARVAPELLAAIAGIYGVERWDASAFERYFVRRALASWKRTLVVDRERESRIHVASSGCPVAREAALDPRVCQACRATQMVATQAAAGPGTRVSFPKVTIGHGDALCEMVISLP